MMVISTICFRNIDWIYYGLLLHNFYSHRFDDVDLSFINPLIDPAVTLNTLTNAVMSR